MQAISFVWAFLMLTFRISKRYERIPVYIFQRMRKGGEIYEHIFFRAYRQNTVQCFDDDGY